MSELFLHIFNTAITAGWLVLAVVLARLLLKKAPAWVHCALWAIVALRLVWPFEIESLLSLVPSTQTVPPAQLYSPVPQVNTGIPVVNNVINPVFSETFAPVPSNSVNPLQVVTEVAGWVWIAGMVAMAIYTALSYYQLKKQVRVRMPVEKGVYLSDGVESPFILGFFAPKIYLPSDIPQEKWESILSHEKAHLARKDHWWKPLGFLLLTIFWFHPLLWLGYILLCRDVERACDEKVIKHLSAEEKKIYSEVLLSCSLPRKWISACPLAFGETGVKGRIKAVLHYKKPTLWILIAALIVGSVLAVCFLTEPKKDVEEPEIYSAAGMHYQLQYGDSMIDTLTITVSADGNFTYYENLASSYIGMGSWYQEGNKLYLYDTGGRGSQYVFLVEADGIRFVKAESTDDFFWVHLHDGTKIPGIRVSSEPVVIYHAAGMQYFLQNGQNTSDVMTLSIAPNGSYAWHDTYVSSTLAKGTWVQEGRMLYLQDDSAMGVTSVFVVEKNSVLYVGTQGQDIGMMGLTEGTRMYGERYNLPSTHLTFLRVSKRITNGFYGTDEKGNEWYIRYDGGIPEDMTQCWVSYYGNPQVNENGRKVVTAERCWLYWEYSPSGNGWVFDRGSFDLDGDGQKDECVLTSNLSASGIFTCKLTVTLADGSQYEAQFHEKFTWDANSGVFIPSLSPDQYATRAYADVFAFGAQDGKLVILSPSGAKYAETGEFLLYTVIFSNGQLSVEAQ